MQNPMPTIAPSNGAAPEAASCLFLISAPSGSGKSTLVGELFRLVPGLEFSISYTTRPARGSEEHGREYFFISRDEFNRMLAEGDFLEHAEVFGNCYGTAWSFLEDARRRGADLVLDIDVQGAAQVRQRHAGSVSIFIAPPDRDTLAWRLRNRGLDTPEVIEHRLRDASREIAAYNEYQYVLINDELPRSVERLQAIVLVERARRRGWPAVLQDSRIPAIESVRLEQLAEGCLQSRVAEPLAPVLHSFGIESVRV